MLKFFFLYIFLIGYTTFITKSYTNSNQNQVFREIIAQEYHEIPL